MLQTAQTAGLWELGSFWTRDKRDNFDGEVGSIPTRWTDFRQNWAFLQQGEMKDLGVSLAEHAEAIADMILTTICTRDSPERCVLHGDGKVANIFYRNDSDFSPEEDKNVPIKFIDFQWTGYGHPVLDIIYLVASSAEDIQDDQFDEAEIIQAYLSAAASYSKDRQDIVEANQVLVFCRGAIEKGCTVMPCALWIN